MHNQEAKIILDACRPSGADANDPAFAEALEQARRDPELQRWFEKQRGLDSAVGAKLKALGAPADLKAAILAGKPARPIVPLWRQPRWLALAASLLAALILPLFWLGAAPQREFAQFQREMLNVLETHDGLDFYSANLSEVQSWLNGKVAVPFEIPQKCQNLSGLGCQAIVWQGKPVGLMCLKTEGSGLVHLFVARSQDLPVAPAGAPKIVRQGDWAIASWRRGDITYLLASAAGPDELRKFL